MTAFLPPAAPQPDAEQELLDDGLTSLVDAPYVVRWGLFDALLGFPAVLFGTLVLGAGLALTIPGAAATAFTLLCMQVMMTGWACTVSRRKGNGPTSDFGLRLVGLSDFISAVVLGFSLLMIAGLVAGAAVWMLGLSTEDQASNTGIVNDAGGNLWKWVMIALVVVGAPVAEELFFRGLLLGALKRRFGSIVAVAGSTVAFTALHFGGGALSESILLLSVIGAIGAVMGAYVIRTGRVLPTIIAHSVFNALVVTANF